MAGKIIRTPIKKGKKIVGEKIKIINNVKLNNQKRADLKLNHSQGFALMEYTNSLEGKDEIIEKVWNSRDGAVNGSIPTKDGKGYLSHINYEVDEILPDYKPLIGERVFIGPVDAPELITITKENINKLKELNKPKPVAVPKSDGKPTHPVPGKVVKAKGKK